MQDCSICLQQIHGKSKKYTLQQCPHVFHRKCISDWAFITQKCPICRKQMSLRDKRELQNDVPLQKKKQKHTHRLFEMLNQEEEVDMVPIRLYANRYQDVIDWDARDNAGLFLSDHFIMLGEPEFVWMALTHHHSVWLQNGDGYNTIQVLNITIRNTNKLPLSQRVHVKLRQNQKLNQEEEEHMEDLRDLQRVRIVVERFIKQHFPTQSLRMNRVQLYQK